VLISFLLLLSIIISINIYNTKGREKLFNITQDGVLALKPEYLNLEKMIGRKRLSASEQEEISKNADEIDLTADEYLFLCFLKSNKIENVFKNSKEAKIFLTKTLKVHNVKTLDEIYAPFKENDLMWDLIIPIVLSEDKTTDLPSNIKVPKKVNGISVSKIKQYAFAYTDIESIELPNGIIYIGNSAFEGCSELTRVKFPDSLKTIESTAFINCNNLETQIPALDNTQKPA
jgi:hypothetical protein